MFCMRYILPKQVLSYAVHDYKLFVHFLACISVFPASYANFKLIIYSASCFVRI